MTATKSQKEINQAFKALLVVDLTGHVENSTAWRVYCEEYGNHTKQDQITAVKNWLLGLPSVLSMPFSYHDIGHWLENNTDCLAMGLDCYDGEVQDHRYWTKAALMFIKTYKNK